MRAQVSNTRQLKAANVLARPTVVDLIAVADVQPVLGAKGQTGPKGMPHKPRESSRKAGVERPYIDPLSRLLDAAGAPTRPVMGLLAQPRAV